MDAIILDIFLNKKIRFLAKRELFKNKFIGFFLKKVALIAKPTIIATRANMIQLARFMLVLINRNN